MCAIWTPVQIPEGNHVASGDTHTPIVFDIPDTQSAVRTATKESCAIGGKGQTIDIGTMPMQHRSTAVSFHIEDADPLVRIAKG
jgi:hypothetical protein